MPSAISTARSDVANSIDARSARWCRSSLASCRSSCSSAATCAGAYGTWNESAKHAFVPRGGDLKQGVQRHVAQKGAGGFRQPRRNSPLEQCGFDPANRQRCRPGCRPARIKGLVHRTAARVVRDLEIREVDANAFDTDERLARPQPDTHRHHWFKFGDQRGELPAERVLAHGQPPAGYIGTGDGASVECARNLPGRIEASPAVRFEPDDQYAIFSHPDDDL